MESTSSSPSENEDDFEDKEETGHGKKKKTKKKEKEIATVIEPPPLLADPTVDMIFEWWTVADFPVHKQFIFIIPQSRAATTESRLDELYHVGFIKNRRLLDAALQCLYTIFYDKALFEMKIDLLFLINEVEDKKMTNEFVFERFIIENISRNFNMNGRLRNIDSDARVSREVFETQEDWSATNKVSFSFYIVGILEEEIDSIIEKVEEMNSETRDMSLDRSAMQATRVILTELDVYLQEKCLESAVESGNLESLRKHQKLIKQSWNRIPKTQFGRAALEAFITSADVSHAIFVDKETENRHVKYFVDLVQSCVDNLENLESGVKPWLDLIGRGHANFKITGKHWEKFAESLLTTATEWNGPGRRHKETVKAWMIMSSYLADRLAHASRIAHHSPMLTPRVQLITGRSAFEFNN
ncbi:unnamed protein product [Caenorhabditis sp. 36 PRJEB53466]|nr:unnamed protein product [Caenorhabditis sp. 36 PRJEB53466]